MNSQINELLNKQDNAEIIRDRIAAILKLELSNQKKIADENKNIKDKKDFNINVYLENSRPWDLISNSENKNPFPLINVCLQETTEAQKPGGSSKTKYTGLYLIDCYGCGNTQPKDAEEYIADDSLSTIRAWQTARVVRSILMSGFYAYLGMRGTVMKRRISKITAIIPTGLDGSAVSVTACRINLEVDFYENSMEAAGDDLEELAFRSNNEGEVSLINIQEKYKEEE